MPPRKRQTRATAAKTARTAKTATAAGASGSQAQNNPPPPVDNNNDQPTKGPERFAPWFHLLNNVAATKTKTKKNQKPPVVVPLTRDNLKMLNEASKKKFPQTHYAFNSSDSSSGSRQSRRRRTELDWQEFSESKFAMVQSKNGILDPTSSTRPVNLDAIRQRLLVQPADTPPTETIYRSYVRNISAAYNTATVAYEVSSLLRKYPDDLGYRTAIDQTLHGFPDDAGLNNGMPLPRIDFIQGYEISEFAPFQVEFLKGAVVFRNNPDSVTLPHITGEHTSRDGNLEYCRLGSAYTGAALVYSRNTALTYMGKSDPAGCAEIVTFTTDGSTLNFYVHYAVKEADGAKYHQYPLVSTNLRNSYDEFTMGWTMLQNCQDYARLISQELRDELLEHYEKHGQKAWAPSMSKGARERLLSPSPAGDGGDGGNQNQGEGQGEQQGEDGDQGVNEPPSKRRRGRPRKASPQAGNGSDSGRSRTRSPPPAPTARYTAKRMGHRRLKIVRVANNK